MNNFYFKITYFIDEIVDELPTSIYMEFPLLCHLIKCLKQGLALLVFKNKKIVNKRDVEIIGKIYKAFYDAIPENEKAKRPIIANANQSIQFHLNEIIINDNNYLSMA